jgi:hypothetical protein
MNAIEFLLLHLPIPYWFAAVLYLYRHDLAVVFHPVRDEGSPRNWWLVLTYLGLLNGKGKHKPSRRSEFLPYAVILLLAALASLFSILRPSPWYFLILVQGASGLMLTSFTMLYVGSPSPRPYLDVLIYPRIGSRVRHLRKISLQESK